MRIFYRCCKILFHLLLFFYSALCSVNLALKRQTVLDNPFNSSTSGSRAVDGEYGGYCAVSIEGQEAKFQVKLAVPSIITRIRCVFDFSRPDPRSLRSYEVHVSADDDMQIDNRLCYKESSSSSNIDPIKKEVFCYTQGKYVTYYVEQLLSGQAVVRICEVEVFGCAVGYYGTSCSNQCSDYCKTSPCEPDYGRCIDGCKPGYYGEQCKDECSYGLYGADCSLNCSSTCLGGDCFNVNGTCKQCEDGYDGSFCEISLSLSDTLGSNDTQNTQFIIVIAVLTVALLLLMITIIYFKACRPTNMKDQQKNPIYKNSVSIKNTEATSEYDYIASHPAKENDMPVLEYETPVAQTYRNGGKMNQDVVKGFNMPPMKNPAIIHSPIGKAREYESLQVGRVSKDSRNEYDSLRQ